MRNCRVYIKIFVVVFVLIPSTVLCQGEKYNWLLGLTDITDMYTTSTRTIINFQSGAPNVTPSFFKMKFQETNGNISDHNGNILMYSNGLWIANATGDTMLNGSDLNPGPFATYWKNLSLSSSPVYSGNMFIPWPGDSNSYALFHMVGNNSADIRATELFYSKVNILLAGGLGGVTTKNHVIFNDTLSWGIGACKHANGRDWWIVAIRDDSDVIFKVLFTPSGISNISTQSFGMKISDYQNGFQPVFSPDGTKFAFTTSKPSGTSNYITQLNYFDFDRCTGQFSNHQQVLLSSTYLGVGSVFSSNSKYLYAATLNNIFQVNTDVFPLFNDTVATYDNFFSPVNPQRTTFWLMYLAANNKIYVSSPMTVLDLTFINYPDSGGLACDVHQHDLHLPSYNVRTVPNHPNYFLGPEIGSVCDSLSIGVPEILPDFHFSISPNPSNGPILIMYLLPQNKSGIFEIFDMEGRKVFSDILPAWSTLQTFNLSEIKSGLYYCTITSSGYRVTKKIAFAGK